MWKTRTSTRAKVVEEVTFQDVSKNWQQETQIRERVTINAKELMRPHAGQTHTNWRRP